MRGAGIWTMWIDGILEILAIIAPFVLGYTDLAGAMWTSIILGAITVIVSAIDIFARGPTAAA